MKKKDDIIVIGVIPARLASSRFPNKLIKKIHNKLTVLEHVWKRAQYIENLNYKFIAYQDINIKKLFYKNINSLISTSSNHKNGTSRVIESLSNKTFDYALLIQGDEPLLIDKEVSKFINVAKASKKTNIVWNSVTKIKNNIELKDSSIVKCKLDKINNIIDCKRNVTKEENYKYKLQGLMIFDKKFVENYKNIKKYKRTQKESIEQLDFLLNKINFKAFTSVYDYPSINYPKDLKKVEKILLEDNIQKKIYHKMIND